MTMNTEKKNWLGPYVPQGSIFREMVQQVKLAYRLFLDDRVPLLLKLIPLVALGYVIWPFDPLPDFIPGLGQLDDIAIVMLGLRLFFEFAPPAVMHEHLQRLAQSASFSWAPTAKPPTADDDIIEGTVIESTD
jgi:uncharacterized membrane protein YkvA (DUF1232 family)